MTKHYYPYLRDEFIKFVLWRAGNLHKIDAMRAYFDQHSQRELYQKIGMSGKEVFERFIAPWQGLRLEQAEAIAQLWNWHFHEEHNQFMEITSIHEPKALYWTVAHMIDLKLFDVFPPLTSPDHLDWLTIYFGSEQFITPYQQCRYCGRLDTDPRGKPFGQNRLFYCHLESCDCSDGNPSAHQEGCCFKAWAQEKQNLRLRLGRHKHDPTEVGRLFQVFCDERYLDNQSIQEPIRILHAKPTMNVTDREALQVYQAQ